MSGVQQGLTMVVGPPGTGKTDTAVQIMHVLYHNQPEQRTLLITHSNQVPPHLSSYLSGFGARFKVQFKVPKGDLGLEQWESAALKDRDW